MSESAADQGWSDIGKDDPRVITLRGHLEADNGIKGLEILEPDNIERAVQLFHRDGFVVVDGVLSHDQTDFLKQGCDEVVADIIALDDGHSGNRGSHRYSFGGSSLTRSQLHRSEWQILLDNPAMNNMLAVLFGSPHYSLRAASGDFCLPGAVDYQPLHSDIRDWVSDKKSPFSSYIDPLGGVTIRDLPAPYICVNFLPQNVTKLNGPTRQIPGTQKSRIRIPGLEDEPEWMRLSTVCPAPAGAMMIRDVRAWHGGTPNISEKTRAIPNLEFYAPWFREPIVPGISYQDYKKLSEHAQKLCQYCVADSSETLETGPTLRAP